MVILKFQKIYHIPMLQPSKLTSIFYVSMYLIIHNYLKFKFMNFYKKKKTDESFKVTPNDTI